MLNEKCEKKIKMFDCNCKGKESSARFGIRERFTKEVRSCSDQDDMVTEQCNPRIR
jgi:hypothetical protein